jgi:hypothetical protein
MFGASSRLKAAEDALAEAEKRIAELTAAPVLVSLNRQGRALRWIYRKDGQTIVIETYSQMSDDLPRWKRELGV